MVHAYPSAPLLVRYFLSILLVWYLQGDQKEVRTKGPSSGIGTFPAQERAGACNPSWCGYDDVDDSTTAIRRPWRVDSSRLCRVNAAGVRCDATTPLPLHLSHDRLDIGE